MVEKFVIAVIILVALGVIGTLIYTAYWNSTHTCAKGHNITYLYQPAPIYVKSGDTMIPIQQSPYERTDHVCDEWKGK